MKKVHLFVSGFVQGVGYRQFIKKEAQKRSITGWVRNIRDGRVEAFFEGDEEKINELLKMCKKGPFLSEVEDVDSKEVTSEETYTQFLIL